jgi:hypothetical protein
VKAAGPTTSIREEPYQAEIIKRYGVRAVIGKGGMGAKTLAGLKESGAVYLNAIGGAAQFYARCIERVTGVSLLEFGTPEAMWHLDVKDFPAIVTMDSREQPAPGCGGDLGPRAGHDEGLSGPGGAGLLTRASGRYNRVDQPIPLSEGVQLHD